MRKLTEIRNENDCSEGNSNNSLNPFNNLVGSDRLKDEIRLLKHIRWEYDWQLVLQGVGEREYLHDFISRGSKETYSGSTVIQYRLVTIGAEEPIYEPSIPSDTNCHVQHWDGLSHDYINSEEIYPGHRDIDNDQEFNKKNNATLGKGFHYY